MPSNYATNSMARSNGGSCCGQLICLLLQIALSLGFLVFIWWIIYDPRLPRVAVTKIELWNFNLTDNPTSLLFNASVRIALRNPSRRVRLYYDSLDAALTYHGASLASVPLQPFNQHHKSTTELPAAFNGTATGAEPVAAFYGPEKSTKTFMFNVKLGVKLRMKLGFIKIGHFNPKFDCSVGAQLLDGGMPVSSRVWVCDR